MYNKNRSDNRRCGHLLELWFIISLYSPFASVFFFATGDAEEIPDAEVGGTLVLEAGREAVFESPVYILGSSGQLLLLVSFLLKNPDFLSRNPDFLLENVEFIIKCSFSISTATLTMTGLH